MSEQTPAATRGRGASPTGCHLQGLLATAAFEGSGRERRERNGGSHLRGSLSLLRKPGHSICEAFQRTLSSRVSPCFPQALLPTVSVYFFFRKAAAISKQSTV